MKCARCDVDYPEGILSRVQGSLVKGPVCGICALEIVNAIHGMTMTSFHGGMAEQYRQQALKHRAKTGQQPTASPQEAR